MIVRDGGLWLGLVGVKIKRAFLLLLFCVSTWFDKTKHGVETVLAKVFFKDNSYVVAEFYSLDLICASVAATAAVAEH